MATLVPHPPYAEDQPLSHFLLLFHTSHRFIQSGALLGLPIDLTASTISARRAGFPIARTALLSSALRSGGVGALIGLALAVPATFGQMRGKKEIEWKDRAWRLLENRGQVEVEKWSGVGMVAGAFFGARRGKVSGSGRVVRMIGTAAIGDLAGVSGYLGWRYGVRGGKWKEWGSGAKTNLLDVSEALCIQRSAS